MTFVIVSVIVSLCLCKPNFSLSDTDCTIFKESLVYRDTKTQSPTQLQIFYVCVNYFDLFISSITSILVYYKS